MDMIGTGLRPETQDIAAAVPEIHFQFDLPYSRTLASLSLVVLIAA